MSKALYDLSLTSLICKKLEYGLKIVVLSCLIFFTDPPGPAAPGPPAWQGCAAVGAPREDRGGGPADRLCRGPGPLLRPLGRRQAQVGEQILKCYL